MRIIKLFILLVAGLTVTSCSTMSMGKLDNVMSDSHDRKELLERVEKFQDALYWGDIDDATAYVFPDLRHNFRGRVVKLRAKERLVESDIQEVDISAKASRATVDIEIRYFGIPSYVVKTRTEKQFWEFHDGEANWLLKNAMTVLETG